MANFPVGILLGISAGACLNVGNILQKKAVNDIPPEARSEKLIRTLIRTPTWIAGLLFQLFGSAVLVIIAQFFIGPALLPGLMASGLIVMGIGAAKILNEKLGKGEFVGIAIMVLAIICLTMSGLSVDVEGQDLLDPGFIAREFTFTIVFLVLIMVLEIAQRKAGRSRGILLALQAGAFLALANYWVSPVSVHVAHLFGGTIVLPDELIVGIIGGVLLALTNVLAISVLQKSFTCGQAANVVPIQQVPINIAPIFVYFGIFLLTPPTDLAVPFLIVGIALILASSFLLTKRHAKLEEIK